MGTRADFYVGRGESAEWIGSIAWDGYPEGIGADIFNATTEAEYRERVAAFIETRDDKSLPSDGWPWPWDDSSTTDFAYAFDAGSVHGSCFGGAWFDPNKEPPEDDNGVSATFPNMKDRKRRPMFGAHSGVIVVSG